MVFEVDNTTEQLINQLQESIQATIYALEEGQREIKDLIDEVKQSSSNLATAAQADLVSEDVSKVRAAISKLATAEQMSQFDMNQVKIIGIVEQESLATEDIKSALPKMSNSIEHQARAILEAQSNSANRLESLINEMSANAAEARIAQLQAISANLDTLSKHLDVQLDKLSSESNTVLTVVESNRTVLSSIADYLSMPGYKRFFKGMEVLRSEATQ